MQICDLPLAFVDSRGVIQNILEGVPIEGVALIISAAGTERSNHYHKEDFHYLFVISGRMQYYERDIEEVFTGSPTIIEQGQMVFTPPMKVHKTVFMQDTILLSLSKRARSNDLHEEDVVRMEF